MRGDVSLRWYFQPVDWLHDWTLDLMLRMAARAGDVHEENHLRAALVAGDSESCPPSCSLRTGRVCVGCGQVEDEDECFYYAPLSGAEVVALELVADAHAAAITLLQDQPDTHVADTLTAIRKNLLIALDRGSFRGDAR